MKEQEFKLSKLALSFEKKFGRKQAEKLLSSALSHESSMENYGKDIFAWAILKCIAFDCVKDYRDYHHFKFTWKEFKTFCIEHRNELNAFNGSIDFLSAMTGEFDFLQESILEE